MQLISKILKMVALATFVTIPTSSADDVIATEKAPLAKINCNMPKVVEFISQKNPEDLKTKMLHLSLQSLKSIDFSDVEMLLFSESGTIIPLISFKANAGSLETLIALDITKKHFTPVTKNSWIINKETVSTPYKMLISEVNGKIFIGADYHVSKVISGEFSYNKDQLLKYKIHYPTLVINYCHFALTLQKA